MLHNGSQGVFFSQIPTPNCAFRTLLTSEQAGDGTLCFMTNTSTVTISVFEIVNCVVGLSSKFVFVFLGCLYNRFLGGVEYG